MSLVLIAFGIYMAVAPTFRATSWVCGRCWLGFLLATATSVVRSTRTR